MSHFVSLKKEDISALKKTRAGETKLGEIVLIGDPANAKYEIFGIPESIGVRANQGMGGTETAWNSFLSSFLNLQHNTFLNGEKIYVSGYFDFPSYKNLDTIQLREKVAEIDLEVSQKVYEIVVSGRIPIIIGGGHNNAYGNLRGASEALGMPLSAINFDIHADFRALEGRHSGNGFSYAYQEGYLKHYAIFGLKKVYISDYMLKEFNKDILPLYFDEIAHLDSTNFESKIDEALEFCQGNPLGIEMDLDAVQNVLSSAITPAGFSSTQALQFIRKTKKLKNLAYLHLCEGAAELYDGRKNETMGKLLAEMVAEFVMD